MKFFGGGGGSSVAERTTDFDLAKAHGITAVNPRAQTVTLDTGQNEIHSTALVGNRLFCGTRTQGWYLIRFNNLDDLTDRTVVQAPNTPDYDDAETMVYVPQTNRLYIAGNRSSKTVIHEVDPDTLDIAFFDNITHTFNNGLSPALASDGTHLFMVTYDVASSRVDKYRLSDKAFLAQATLTGRPLGHALIYDGESLYAGGNGWIAKINPTDLTFVDAALPQTGQVTDDGICSVGDYIFVGQEGGTVEQVHRIEKDNLTTAVASGIGDVDCHALHFDGRYVWHVGPATPGIVRRIEPNTLAVRTYTLATGENNPNDIVSDAAGRLLVTCFLSPAKVKRFFPLP